MAELGGAHSQTLIPLLSSVDERYLRLLPSLYLLPLEGNRSSLINQTSKRKLEDYLDPVLLQTISSRIGRTEIKEKPMDKKNVFVKTNQRTEFDWLVDRLGPLIKDPNRETPHDYREEDDGALLLPPTRPSLRKRSRSDFSMWLVNDNNHRTA